MNKNKESGSAWGSKDIIKKASIAAICIFFLMAMRA